MNQVDKINKEWSASEMRLLQLVSGYESALTTYVLPLQGIAQTNGNFASIVREWLKITEEMKALIMKEYEALYGKKATFEQIRSEYNTIRQGMYAPVSYGEEPQMGLK